MKNTIFFSCLIACIASSCSPGNTPAEAAPETASPAPSQDAHAPADQQPGNVASAGVKSELAEPLLFVGEFEVAEYGKGEKPSYSNRINITIEAITEDSLFGHSVVAGNSRPFKGTIEKGTGGSLIASVREPGDDKYDGEFTLLINENKSEVTGTWTSFSPSLAVTGRRFDLLSTTFTYNPNLGLQDMEFARLYDGTDNELDGEFATSDAGKFNASVVELKKEDIENMYQGDLEVMRNAIYARHGYSFKNRKMRYVFDKHVDWYIPMYTDVTAMLTPLEKKNIELIKRYEKHAAKYYDSFGR